MAVETFKASIKKDPAMYPMLHEAHFWPQFETKFTAIAKLHGAADVLDPTYQPVTADEAALFESHKEFIHALLLMKIETSKGRLIVDLTKDAQECWEKLKNKHSGSTEADVNAESIHTELTMA